MRDAATSPTYHGLLLLLLVRLTKHEPLTEHRPVVRTSQHMCAAQENFNIAASPSWSWPHALGEREVGRGGSFASAAWPRAGAARKLGPGGPRTHHLCHRSLGIDPARLTGRPWSMRASETTAHVRVSTALRLRDPARPREELASFSSGARTCCPEKSGVGRPNAGVEAVGLARRTWRLLGVLPVLLGAAISHFGHGASVAMYILVRKKPVIKHMSNPCTHTFTTFAQDPFQTNIYTLLCSLTRPTKVVHVTVHRNWHGVGLGASKRFRSLFAKHKLSVSQHCCPPNKTGCITHHNTYDNVVASGRTRTLPTSR